MQLTPLLVLRCEPGSASAIAVRLRDGGYTVSKVHDDETALAIAAADHVAAFVVDLPVIAAVQFVRRLGPTTPALVVTSSPEAVHRACGASVVPSFSLDDLVSAADRMLIDHELAQLSTNLQTNDPAGLKLVACR